MKPLLLLAAILSLTSCGQTAGSSVTLNRPGETPVTVDLSSGKSIRQTLPAAALQTAIGALTAYLHSRYVPASGK